ncbi:ABC transporter ATP-binding protein [Clostridium cylindrosporum]|uniref:ABC-type antimicrobial peptide transport system, ATPase component n=1 Tax=Clostridium cylindrosporum DSM 605 TaxID=1121307 RepID=A0A0J8DDT6_CLOCY|nr:ABC transporter ATP-binding protein [Clostridium cylindrosporum]KMT22388.1 ABC-type antimicrobial peptide transport system, ATPase component [Clostridium cylindrosporum DSM 605]
MGVLKLENTSYSYDNGKTKILENVSYEFEKGRVYAIIGKSGAGKTTLLSLLSGLTSPTSGRILYNGMDIKKIDKYRYRSRYVGVIFQGFNLLPQLNAIENVELSIDISGKKIQNRREHILNILKKVQLDEAKAKRRILKLSGGEQQRVAIARALSYSPDIILADEPTGNLDLDTQDEVMDIFKKLATEEGKCIIIVTHSPEVAKRADFLYELTPLKKFK